MEKKKRKKRRLNRERIIICLDCKAEVKTRYSRTVRCPECSKKHAKEEQKKRLERQREENAAREKVIVGYKSDQFIDSHENIQKCLNCKMPRCVNCIAYATQRRYIERRKERMVADG